MLLEDKKILDGFLKLRTIAVNSKLTDSISVSKMIKDLILKFSDTKAIDDIHMFKICQSMIHYREVISYQNVNPDTKLLTDARKFLIENIENKSNIIKAITYYSIGMSYVPFIFGSEKEVYEKLLGDGSFNDYFDGIKLALVFFEKSRDIDLPVKLRAFEDNIRNESYSVWSRYSDSYYLSDIIFCYFLNSNLKFREIAAINDSYLKDIKSALDETKRQ